MILLYEEINQLFTNNTVYLAILINIACFEALSYLLAEKYRYHFLANINKEYKLLYKLDKIIEHVKSKFYRDIARVILLDVRTKLSASKIEEVYEKLGKFELEPPEEFEDNIRNYESILEKLYLIRSLVKEAQQKYHNVSEKRGHFMAILAGIFAVFLALIIISENPTPLSLYIMSLFFTVIFSTGIMSRSNEYKEHSSEVIGILSKFHEAIIRDEIKDEKEKYEVLINIILGELGGKTQQYKHKSRR